MTLPFTEYFQLETKIHESFLYIIKKNKKLIQYIKNIDQVIKFTLILHMQCFS